MDIASERKYLTVLFSDISAYSRLTDRLDPEDVLKISSQIFQRAAKIVHDYGGYIERVMGDEILVFFGVPATFEDAAVRAIRAAMDIHRQVQQLDAQIMQLSGHPLRMHSGISSGLVVTGKTDIHQGKDGFAGRPINIAAYLKNLSGPDEILVAHDTYCQTEGFFDYEPLGPQKVKSQSEPIPAYRVLAAKNPPVKLHHVSGLRAELIGRSAEIGTLQQAAAELKQAKKKIVHIVGDAGTGKSRLVQEFKARIKPSGVQWLEGHAYAYRQNAAYFPFRDLLSRVFGIEESESTDTVKFKLQSGIDALCAGSDRLPAYIGTLYGIKDKAANSLHPEFLKSKIESSVDKIFKALAAQTPSIFCFEDIHWADTSSIDLLQKIARSMNQPVMFICTQRPPATIFDDRSRTHGEQDSGMIKLNGLSSQDAQRMLQSLLQTENIPTLLEKFLNQNSEGNPLYLEELVNSLIESGKLTRSDNTWKFTGSIDKVSLPSTIHGIIAERFDKLEVSVKTVLQETVVIGKNFSPLLLEKISSHPDSIAYALHILQQHDFIQQRQEVSGLEYTLKHALTHEVIYESILQHTRKTLHERIGRVMEMLYSDRKGDFCETLAFHFIHKDGRQFLFQIAESFRNLEKAIVSSKSHASIALLISIFNRLG